MPVGQRDRKGRKDKETRMDDIGEGRIGASWGVPQHPHPLKRRFVSPETKLPPEQGCLRGNLTTECPPRQEASGDCHREAATTGGKQLSNLITKWGE